MRLLYSVMALALTGCALETALLPGADDLTREPSYRVIVSNSIETIVGDPRKIGGTEISGVRRTDFLKGPAWLVCVKSNLYQQPKYYAAFIQNEKLVDSRLAVTLDQCEAQSYAPFDDWRSRVIPVRDQDKERR
jgi:hypothetical protein